MHFGPRTMFFFMLLMAMPVAAWWFMFEPARANIEAVRTEISQNRQKLDDLAKKTTDTKNMASEVDKLRKAVEFFEKKLPEEKELASVFTEVSEIAQKNNLNTKSVRILKVIPGSNYSEQPIKLTINGPMKDGFYKFLCDVERMKRLTRINDMKIEADDKVPGNVNVELVLTIYFDGSQNVAVAQ
jgi:Tfp pilus assembly protein PilO